MKEEIQEGIEKILENSYDTDYDYSASQGDSHDEYDVPTAKAIINFLHSRGVVIKEDWEHIGDVSGEEVNKMLKEAK